MMDRARGFVHIMFVMWLLKSVRKVISVKLEHEQRTISAHSNKIPIIRHCPVKIRTQIITYISEVEEQTEKVKPSKQR